MKDIPEATKIEIYISSKGAKSSHKVVYYNCEPAFFETMQNTLK